MASTELDDRWPELKARIREEHPDVDADALERTPEGRRQLMQLIDTHYGLSNPKDEDSLHPVIDEPQGAKHDTSD